jgi:O-antigen ligase
MKAIRWLQVHISPRLHWGLYLWVALLPIQLPLERVLGLRLALSDVALAGTLFVGLACQVLGACPRPERRLRRTNLDGYLAALVAVFAMALGVAWARTGELTAYTLVNKGAGILVLVASLYVAVVLASAPERLRRVVATLLGSVGAVNAVSLALYGAWLRSGGQSPVMSGQRLAGFLIDPNAYGGLLTVALLVQLGVLIGGRTKSRWVQVAGAANVLLLGAGLVLTRSRSAWVALAVGGVVFLWLIRRRLTWKRVLIAATAVGCAGASLWVVAGDAVMSLLRSALQPTSILLRWEQVTGGLRYFPDSPVWGIGLDVYRRLQPPYIIHNTYVWFLVEMGVIGLIVLLALLSRVGRNWAAALRSTDWSWGLAVGGTAAFAAMLGLAVGIEALYQRPLWLLFALAEVLRQRASQGRLDLSAVHAKEPPEGHSSGTPAAS